MTRYITLFFLTIILTEFSNAQKLIKIDKGCSYYGEAETAQIYVKECQDNKTLKIIDDILSTVSLQRNFEIYEANINNAIATTYDNQRLIIIDPNFLKAIETKTNDKYTTYLIIAHEIGHHLNAHLTQSKNQSPWWDELEADQFAGSVLQKLGIPSTTINNVINLIAPSMSNSDTHPEWQARMKASINGYCQSEFLEFKRQINPTQKIDVTKIITKEKQLEQFLNSIIYNKADWERNIKYVVSNRKIFREYETTIYDGEEHKTFKKAKDTIEIPSISKIYLRWHDPGEVAIETSTIKYETLSNEANSTTANIETFQDMDAIKNLNPNNYFDNEVTISDDLSILLKLSNFIATLQKYYELSSKS